jgi:hypothetical protein
VRVAIVSAGLVFDLRQRVSEDGRNAAEQSKLLAGHMQAGENPGTV